MLMAESALWEERRLRVHVSAQHPAATVSCEQTNHSVTLGANLQGPVCQIFNLMAAQDVS